MKLLAAFLAIPIVVAVSAEAPIQSDGRTARARLVESLVQTNGVKPVAQFDEQPAPEDWLIQPPSTRAAVQVLAGKDHQSAQIMLANGLISRTFLNPVFMHLRNSDSESIRRAVDQCVETGFEMIILTFGCGFNMESTDRELHVNPALPPRGLAMAYNPLAEPVRRTLRLPLYYTGLTDTATIREQEGQPKAFTLDREFNVSVPVTVPANGYTWLVIE
jgi:hypothetical protein